MAHPAAPLATLDQEELLQLAVNASSESDSASAIVYLKEAILRADATAMANYLLGAEYSQIRMYDRAVEAMTRALTIDPAFGFARLQLGLLWLTARAADRAEDVLAPLVDLPESDALRHFGAGLCDLIHERTDQAGMHIERGIALNASNPGLSADMRTILDEMTCQQGAA
jgi:tetratricopeptide (TPR) repeat protein